MAISVAFAGTLVFEPRLYDHPNVRNPIALVPSEAAFNVISGVGLLLILAGTLGAFASLVLRYKRGEVEQRHQIKWFVFTAMAVIPAFILTSVSDTRGPLVIISAAAVALRPFLTMRTTLITIWGVIRGRTEGSMVRTARSVVAGLSLSLVAILPACSSGAASTGGDRLKVVAAENFWGSIAGQLGGDRVELTSIIDNPNADPHDYEPKTADARSLASARFVIVNGIGYDPWADRLLAANPVPGRDVLNVGKLVGVPVSGNPHRWYSPSDVQRVIEAITAEYKKLDPTDASDFDQLRSSFETKGLADYHRLISNIRAKYAGTPAGASECIFALMAPALGLDLITPPSFLTAISEGIEPTAADKATIDHQIQSGEIKVYVYNSQNATPDIQRQIEEARSAGIPVATITETLVPASASFQAWQVRELRGLTAALAQASGR